MAQPVDLQNVLSKTQATEKLAKLEKARPDVSQKQAAAEFQTKVDNKHKKVSDLDKTDEVIIHRDQEKEKQEKQKEEKKSSGRSNETDDDGDKNNEVKNVDFIA
ncbi:MAG: hypothetical protein GY855_11610 [candidate division Zixibacteria bacterium]|nr:hypothetical protein [candidate division Zixibacteria bacterium]